MIAPIDIGRQLGAYPRMAWRLLGTAWSEGQDVQGIDRITARSGV